MNEFKGVQINEVEELELFKDVKKSSLKMISSYGVEKKYQKGTIIFRDKEKVDVVYIILEGKFALYKIGEDAQKRVIFIMGRGKILNEVILDDLPASINCEVFEAGRLLVIDRYKLLSIMESDFRLTKSIINSLSAKVRRLYRQMKNSTPSKKIEKKIAAKLWKLSVDYGIENKEGIEINLNLSITYLADMLGSQRETVSRSIRQLEEKDLIVVNNKRIVIKDREKLANFFKGL